MVLLDAAAAVLPVRRLLVATFDHGTGPDAARAAALVANRSRKLGIECVSERAQTSLSQRSRTSRGAVAVSGARCARFRRSRVYGPHRRRPDRNCAHADHARSRRARARRTLRRQRRPSSDARRHAPRRDRVRAAETTDWVEDPSNASPRYLRNRIRADLLPAMRRVHQSIDAELLEVATTAARWRSEVEAFVAQDRWRTGTSQAVRAGRRCGDARRISGAEPGDPLAGDRGARGRDARSPRDTAPRRFYVGARVGARVQVSGGWEVIRSRDALQLRASRRAQPTPSPLALSDTTSWYEWSFRPADQPDADDAWFARLPADRPLVVRAWGPGDAMGVRSSGRVRKVKAPLSEAGVTGHQRRLWPVVVAQDGGEIVWIPGVRRSDAAFESASGSGAGLSFFCEYVNR